MSSNRLATPVDYRRGGAVEVVGYRLTAGGVEVRPGSVYLLAAISGAAAATRV
jgi:hypothetical protein